MDGKREKKTGSKNKIDFTAYRLSKLENFLKLVIIPIEKLRWKEIEEFRKDWEIPSCGFKTDTKLKNWYKAQQKKYLNKKDCIVYFENEIVYEIENGKIANIIPLDFLEKYPRVLELGHKLEAVFDHDVRLLMNKLELDYDWAKLFKQYLLFGKHSIKSVRSPSVFISERICVDENGEEVDHKFSFNISPNTQIEEINLLNNFIVKHIREHTKNSWLGKRRKSKSLPILEKLIDLETNDEKRNIKRSNSKKGDRLFGNLVDDPRFSQLSDDDFAKEDAIRIKKIKNLRRHYPKLKPSQ
jgi:hypothetical protein